MPKSNHVNAAPPHDDPKRWSWGSAFGHAYEAGAKNYRNTIRNRNFFRTKNLSRKLLLISALGVVATLAILSFFVKSDIVAPFIDAAFTGFSVVGLLSIIALGAGLLNIANEQPDDEIASNVSDELENIGIAIATRNGVVVYHNDSYCRVMALENSADCETPDRNLARTHDAAPAIFRLSKAAEDGESWSETIRVSAQESDATRWLTISTWPHSGKSSDRLVAWSTIDVTRDHELHEEYFKKAQQLLDYVDFQPCGFMAYNKDGNITFVNATLAGWLGKEIFEITGQEISNFFTSPNILLTANQTTNREVCSNHPDLIDRDGKLLPTKVRTRARPNSEGEFVATVNLLGDEEIIKNELNQIFDRCPFPMAFVDAQSKLGNYNEAFAKLIRQIGGTNTDLSLDGNFIELFEGKEHKKLLRELEKAGQRTVGDDLSNANGISVQLKGKQVREATLYLSPMGNEGSTVVFAYETTKYKELERKATQDQKMHEIGLLAGGIAHDFNNILTTIGGNTELIMFDSEETDTSYKYLTTIQSAHARAKNLVSQLLAYSRRETLEDVEIQLKDKILDYKNELLSSSMNNIDIKVLCDSNLWYIKADETKLTQILLNLAINARDSMQPRGGTLTINLRNIAAAETRDFDQSDLPKKDFVLIEVSDTGCGMPKDIMEKIFEPFFTTKDIGQGTGFGLSTVLGIIMQSNGHIYPESKVGLGTTFRIFLPRHLPTSSERRVASKPEVAMDITGFERILIVEDEPSIRQLAQIALGRYGYQIEVASNGREALDIILNDGKQFDLIISDIMMPELDGPGMLRELAKHDLRYKVLLMSGDRIDGYETNSDLISRIDYISKPFDLTDLAQKVKEMLSTSADHQDEKPPLKDTA